MSALKVLVLKSGDVLCFQPEAVESGWSLTAAEARVIAANCAAAIADGRRRVVVGEDATRIMTFDGDVDALETLRDTLTAAADVADAQRAVKH